MNFVKTTYQGKDVDLGCAHWRSFPPRALAVAPDHSPEDMRAKKIIDEPEYQRFKVWQSVCNLTAIEPEKCLQCPHARIAGFRKGLPVLVTLNGKLATPTLDLPSLETSSRLRKQLEDVPDADKKEV
jgi:hypothetical protein